VLSGFGFSPPPHPTRAATVRATTVRRGSIEDLVSMRVFTRLLELPSRSINCALGVGTDLFRAGERDTWARRLPRIAASLLEMT